MCLPYNFYADGQRSGNGAILERLTDCGRPAEFMQLTEAGKRSPTDRADRPTDQADGTDGRHRPTDPQTHRRQGLPCFFLSDLSGLRLSLLFLLPCFIIFFVGWKENKKAYIMEYKRSKIKRVPFDLNTETDRDILEFLEEIENKNGYIKNLIREDIDRRKKP